MRLFPILTTCALVLLGGCMQPPPKPIAGCDYHAVPITVDSGHPRMLGAAEMSIDQAGDQDRLAREMGGVLGERRARRAQLGLAATAEAPDQFLVLSGGGEHGAFGAGMFYGIGQVPSYDIVTGVSTGSLQSTLLFLANSPVPADRTDYRWVDGPLASGPADGFVVKPGVSNIGDLVLAYSIAKEADLMRIHFGGAAGGIVFDGASASFAPLRARLKALLTIGTLREVGREWEEEKRQLWVGVTNLDDGAGYAIDMTELAARTRHSDDPARLAQLQGCYVDALLASSSVPPGVPPVTLATRKDVRMYMDGGARFGVILGQVLRAEGDAPKRAKVTLIVNHDLYSGPWQADGQPTLKWSAATFGLRAIDLLENQVYRFSIADAERYGMASGGLRMAFIGNENIAGGEAPDDHRFRGKSCAEWNAIDDKAKPLQFHAQYMACLADYGRVRGAAGQWNRAVR